MAARDRRHPLFVALCDRLGLVAYWTETGTWLDCANDASLPYDFRKTVEAHTDGGRERLTYELA